MMTELVQNETFNYKLFEMSEFLTDKNTNCLSSVQLVVYTKRTHHLRERKIKKLKPDYKKEYVKYNRGKKLWNSPFQLYQAGGKYIWKENKNHALQAVRSLLNKETFQCRYCSSFPCFGNACSLPEAPSFGHCLIRIIGISGLVISLEKSQFMSLQSFNQHKYPTHAVTTNCKHCQLQVLRRKRYSLRIYITRSLKQAM